MATLSQNNLTLGFKTKPVTAGMVTIGPATNAISLITDPGVGIDVSACESDQGNGSLPQPPERLVSMVKKCIYSWSGQHQHVMQRGFEDQRHAAGTERGVEVRAQSVLNTFILL